MPRALHLPSSPAKSPHLGPRPAGGVARRVVAGLLRSASAVLARMARRLSPPVRRARGDARLEFYAEAGAPEGALYLDGEFVGWLPGVARL
jgi:hypothetical protein